MIIMQSRQWQEEPDLMAIDRDGHLYIFELKAWESQPENLLQVLRYGQIFKPSKYKIERLTRGDVVFLYQTRVGIVAVGVASGNLEKHPYQGKPEHPDEEYSMPLKQFKQLEHPIPAAVIKEITDVNYSFRGTLFALDETSGKKLYVHITQNAKKNRVAVKPPPRG